MFKETEKGATNYCLRCELEAKGVKIVNYTHEDKSTPITDVAHTCGKCKHGNFTPDCDMCFAITNNNNLNYTWGE